MRAESYLISFILYLYFILSGAVFWLGAVVIFLVTYPFDRRRRWLHLYTCFWGYHYILICPFWRASFSGREHILPGHTYVLAANHQSWVDVPLLFGLFKHFKWVSKREMFRVPFMGWNMIMSDYVPLARGRRSSIAEMMRHCDRHLEAGSSVLIFPEGTRSPDGEIHSFKAGAVSMALRANVPVIPIVVDGTGDALPKHGLILRPRPTRHFQVKILAPMTPDGESDAATFARRVHETMKLELARMRGDETPRERAHPGVVSLDPVNGG